MLYYVLYNITFTSHDGFSPASTSRPPSKLRESPQDAFICDVLPFGHVQFRELNCFEVSGLRFVGAMLYHMLTSPTVLPLLGSSGGRISLFQQTLLFLRVCSKFFSLLPLLNILRSSRLQCLWYSFSYLVLRR